MPFSLGKRAEGPWCTGSPHDSAWPPSRARRLSSDREIRTAHHRDLLSLRCLSRFLRPAAILTGESGGSISQALLSSGVNGAIISSSVWSRSVGV